MQSIELMGDAVRIQAKSRPDAVACSAGDRDVTFAALDRRANQIANGLIAAGCRPGARIGVLASPPAL